MKLTLLSFFLLLSIVGSAQETSSPDTGIKRNSIYAELLGNGGVYSINYDRIFQLNNHLKIVPRVGFSTLQNVIIVPIEANLLISGSKTSKNFFEGGLGVTILKPLSGFSGQLLTINGYDYDFKNEAVNTPLIVRAGFRHQKPKGGLMYRTGLLLFTGEDSLLTLGIGIGYTF
ncbi:hypothetical protein [Pedobacter frigidisoli]|uniref:hypothetical protein n=1 Tax=Pedobacter frigidisoli TaxID=2530455 RepID=UPI00292D7870|nr:hypothetical protein [Pedobacter frigidisoli]